MRISCKYIICLLFSVSAFISHAQDEWDEYQEKKRIHTNFKESLLSIRASCTLPAPVSNQVLREKFRGIYELNLSLNIRVSNGFFVGIGGKDGLLGMNRIPNPNTGIPLNTKMQLYTGYIKLGFNKFHNENVFSSISLNAGYNSSFFTGIVHAQSPVTDKTYSSFLLEPEYCLNLAIEENFTIGIFISYNYMPSPFNPTNIALQDVTGIGGLKTNSATGIINFGFGFYYGMGKQFTRRDR